MTERKKYVDIFKGLAIILVVIGHTNAPIVTHIYLFHVPAFFFIAGYLSDLERQQLPEFLLKKIHSLLTPFIAINILFLFLVAIFTYLDIHILQPASIYPTEIKSRISDLIFNFNAQTEIAGATWFLVTLFQASIIAALIVKFIHKFNLKNWLALLTTFLLMKYAYNYYAIKTPWLLGLDLAASATFYYVTGWYFMKKRIRTNTATNWTLTIITGIAIFFFGSYYFIPQNWPPRIFESEPFLNILTSIIGIALLYFGSKLIEKVRQIEKVLSYIGSHTISILFFHFLGFKIFHVGLYLIGSYPKSSLPELVPYSYNTYWPLISIFAIAFSLCADFIIRKIPYIGFFILGFRDASTIKILKKIFVVNEKNR